jgi:hypothetical protein
LERLRPVLANPDIEKIGQNIKYDWMVLRRHGVDLAGVDFDTMVASYLIDPGKRAHGLDQIALDYLGHKNITYAEVAGKGKAAVTFDQVTLEKAIPYACEDADMTLAAHDVFVPLLKEKRAGRSDETGGDAPAAGAAGDGNDRCLRRPGPAARPVQHPLPGSWTSWNSRSTIWPVRPSTSTPPSSWAVSV